MREASVGHQCPECVAEGKRSQRPARTAFGGSDAGRSGYVTRTLIAINVLVMIAGAIAGGAGALAGSGGWFGLLGGETPVSVWGEVLGYAGNTGDAEPTPPHLHFEIHPGGEPKPSIDPYPIVTRWQDDAGGRHTTSTDRPGSLVTVRDFLAP